MKARYLLLNVDKCAVGFCKTQPNEFFSKVPSTFLSPTILKQVKEGNYQGFIILTHVRYITMKNRFKQYCETLTKLNEHLNWLNSQVNTSHKEPFLEFLRRKGTSKTELDAMCETRELDISNIFITKVVENIQNATGLPCIAVSTPDDIHHHLGYGFKTILKPFEAAIIKKSNINLAWLEWDEKYLTDCGFSVPNKKGLNTEEHLTSKNEQLSQILDYFKALTFKSEKVEVELDFIDDVKDILRDVISIELPQFVRKLSLYHFDITYSASIEHYATLNGPEKKKESCLAFFKKPQKGSPIVTPFHLRQEVGETEHVKLSIHR